MENTDLNNEKNIFNLQNDSNNNSIINENNNLTTSVTDSISPNQTNQGSVVAEQQTEHQTESSILDEYTSKFDKPRKNAIALMVLSMLAMLVSIVVGVYFIVKISIQIFGVNSDALFDQTNNLKTFGLAGLSGILLYALGCVLIIVLLAITYVFASSYFKLFKNLKNTKCQPYCLVKYNGTMKLSLIKSVIFVALSVVAVVISVGSKINTDLLIMLIVLACVCAVVMIDLLIEMIVGGTSFSRLEDENLKAEIKNKYKFSFFKKRVSDSDRAKNRKRWF